MNPYQIQTDFAAFEYLRALADQFAPEQIEQVMLSAAALVGVAVEGYVSDYPLQTHKPLPLYYTRVRKDGTVYKSKFKSMAQQRKVGALFKEKKIPHKRKGTLGKSLTSRAERVGPLRVRTVVGSAVAHAPWVIDREKQSHYHKGNWTPLQDDVEKHLPQIIAYYNSTFVNGALALLKK